jgi:CBS domain-containing protein
MENIANILAKKQTHFNKIPPSASIRDALVRMNSHHTDHLIVTDTEDNFLGLLTEHEIVSKILLNNPKPDETTIGEVMNTSLPVADSSDTIEDCMRLMKRFDVRYLPVFDQMQFMGIISADDILRHAVIHRGEIFDKVNKNVSLEYSH